MQQSSFITLYIVYNIEKVIFLQNIFYRKNDVKTKIIFYLFDLMLYLDFFYYSKKNTVKMHFFPPFQICLDICCVSIILDVTSKNRHILGARFWCFS